MGTGAVETVIATIVQALRKRTTPEPQGGRGGRQADKSRNIGELLVTGGKGGLRNELSQGGKCKKERLGPRIW